MYLSISPFVGLYLSIPISLLTTSAISTHIACPVPPALLIGPEKNKSTYSVPSLFFPILTSAIPSKGATNTPSVSIARPVRIAWSIESPVFLKLYFFSLTISFAISSDTNSRFPIFFVAVLILGAIPFGPTSCSTLDARSRACGIST